MGKISNFTIFFVTLSILIVIIITSSTIAINNQHDEKLMYAMETKIEYYAKRCYLENNCKDVITLDDLYNKGYLEEIVNPVTKEVIDYKTTITYNEGKIKINW